MSDGHDLMIVLDTDQIQSFIFSTNKLKEIQGASALLDELNLVTVPENIITTFPSNNLTKDSKENYKIDKGKNKDDVDCRVISFGGGSVRLTIRNSLQDKGQELISLIRQLYFRSSGDAVSISGVMVERIEDEDMKQWIMRSELALRFQKQNTSQFAQSFSSPFFKTCESSGLCPASHTISEVGITSQRFVGTSIHSKIRKSSSIRNYFHRFSAAAPLNDLPGSLNDICTNSTPEGYVGVIFADANRMGYRLHNHFESLSELSNFSEKIKIGIEKSLFTALRKNRFDKRPYKYKFQIFLIGGDDVLLAVPASKALQVAIDFAQTFDRQKFYQDSDRQVSLGIGVVLAHGNHPLHHLAHLAHELAASAKKKSMNDYQKTQCNQESSYINFIVAKGAGIKDYDKIESDDLSYSDHKDGKPVKIKLHERPYDIPSMINLLQFIKELKQNQMPRNKLSQLYRALHSGWGQGTLESLTVASRLPEKARKILFERFKDQDKLFPWWKNEDNEWETNLIDMIELYDFIEE